MDRRTKILAGVFGIGILYALVSTVVYPKWIEPQLKIYQTIAKKREAYDKLRAREALVDRAKEEYRELAARAGSFDADKVENDVHAALNTLIEKHGFAGADISRTKPTRDRKTGLQRMKVTVSATAKLEDAVGFLEDVAKLPHLARVGNLRLDPASSRRRSGSSDRVNVTVPIELLVLGQHKFVGRFRESELAQPEEFVRHQDRDHSSMWAPNPFTEYEELLVDAGRTVTVDAGEPASLRGSASGGAGNYTYVWAPVDELSDATTAKPQVADTSTPGRREFTLTVTDGAGATAKATVTVTVRPPLSFVADAGSDLAVDAGEPATLPGSASGGSGGYTFQWEPADLLRDATIAKPRIVDTSSPGRQEFTLTVTDGAGATATATVMVTVHRKPFEGFRDRDSMRLCMVTRTGLGSKRRDESTVYNSKSKETTYYKVGDEFDGGRLVFVHQSGLLVRRQNDYFVYPLGARLDQDTAVEQAVDFPVLTEAANRIRAAEELAALQAQEIGGINGSKRETAQGPIDSKSSKDQEKGKAKEKGPPEDGEAKDKRAEDGNDRERERRPGGRRPRRTPPRHPGRSG